MTATRRARRLHSRAGGRSMRRNLVLLAGAAGLTTLALVGGGVNASFTSTAKANAQISTGVFALQATPAARDAQGGDGGDGSLSFYVDRGGDGQASKYDFDVLDTGTLAGTIDSIAYQPDGSAPKGSTFELQHLRSGQWTSIGVPVDASQPYTFSITPGLPVAPTGPGSAGGVSFRILAHSGTQTASATVTLRGSGSVCAPQQGSGGGSEQGSMNSPLTGTATTIGTGSTPLSLVNGGSRSTCGDDSGSQWKDSSPPAAQGLISGTLTIAGMS